MSEQNSKKSDGQHSKLKYKLKTDIVNNKKKKKKKLGVNEHMKEQNSESFVR